MLIWSLLPACLAQLIEKGDTAGFAVVCVHSCMQKCNVLEINERADLRFVESETSLWVPSPAHIETGFGGPDNSWENTDYYYVLFKVLYAHN